MDANHLVYLEYCVPSDLYWCEVNLWTAIFGQDSFVPKKYLGKSESNDIFCFHFKKLFKKLQ